jgi:hypothetical protein
MEKRNTLVGPYAFEAIDPEQTKENIVWCVAATFVTASCFLIFTITLLVEYVRYG